MRRFFLLTVDSRLTGVHAVVPNYPAFNLYFEYYQVTKCRTLPADFLVAAQLREIPGKRVDFVGNPLGWPIVSPAMLKVFDEFGNSAIQVLRFTAVDSSGKPVLSDYRVMNVLACLEEVIDLERSVTSHQRIGTEDAFNVISPVFRAERIPEATHVFRPKQSLSMLVISEELAEAVVSADLVGYALVETGRG
jgi:hypothetical protein